MVAHLPEKSVLGNEQLCSELKSDFSERNGELENLLERNEATEIDGG